MSNVFLVMFDADMVTSEDAKIYRSLVKYLESRGYKRIQKSVFARMTDTELTVLSDISVLKSDEYKSVKIRVLPMAYSLFDKMININCEKEEFLINKNSIFI